jgi:PqqD family protein of HPr-rel-A system
VTAERRYHQDSNAALCVLEDITLLYHRSSGQTHMVISPVPEILDALGEDDSPVTAAQVHARLERRYDLGEPEQAIAEIEAHLAGLTAFGVVRRA